MVKPTEEIKISDKEKRILALSFRGLSAADIAEQIFVSKYTVHSHLQNLRARLNCRNTSEAVYKVLCSGIDLIDCIPVDVSA